MGASTVNTFTPADNLLTATVVGNYQNVFRAGDLIVLKLDAEIFQRAFWVVDIITATTLQLADFGTLIVGNVVGLAGAHQLFRYRFGDIPANISRRETFALVTQPSMEANNVYTANADSWEGLSVGDIFCVGVQAGIFHGQTVINRLLATTGNSGSFNVQTNVAANVNNVFTVIRYRDTEILELDSIGYVRGTADTLGHAVSIAVPVAATGDNVLTITKVGATSEIPNVNNNFRIGDLITIQTQATGFRQALVTGVDPANNNRSLLVIGSRDLAGALNAANDARTFILQRIRFNDNPKPKYVNRARQVKEFEIIWKPASLPIFNVPHALPGGTKFEFELDPFQNTFYQRRAIESASEVQLVSGTDYKFLVTDLRLYIAQCQGKIMEKGDYYIDMNRVKCHKVSLTTNSLTTTSIDVQPSSFALALAFQDKGSGSRSDLNPSLFKIRNSEELNLERYSIRFAGRSVPTPDFDGDFNKSTNKDRLTYLYVRNMLYNGAYFDNSQERADEWRDRGIYFYHPFLRSATFFLRVQS